jgi:nitrogen fixation/metabolism regulation signal transduction histidine kinase
VIAGRDLAGLGRRFEVGLALRIGVLLATGAALAWAINQPALYATTLLAGLVTGATLAELWLFLRRTNLAVARFVVALTHGDFTQGFSGEGLGSGFDALGASLDAAITRLRHERADTQEQSRFLAAMVDDVPSPLISVDDEGRISLINKASRRLLGASPDATGIAESLATDIAALRPGERRSTRLTIGGVPTAALLTMAEVRLARRPALRIIAVQPIQIELDQAELAAQTDLVRVLTHEIMNSMTPVTSLSATAAKLIAAADTGADPAITDARHAIETVARRSEGIMHFVRTYRQLTRPPELRRSRIELSALFAELERLFTSDWPTIPLSISIDPPTLAIDADRDLVAQSLINLLRNAAEAATENAAEAATDHAAEAATDHAAEAATDHAAEAAVSTAPTPHVTLSATSLKGGRIAIDVIDNGPGIAESLRQDVFLPFFSTKAQGTGVGLSLARQIALAHGGALTCEPASPCGTRLRLLL